MENIAKIINLDDNVEEEVLIKINGVDLVAFITYSPYLIEIDHEYSVEIVLFADDVDIKENNQEEKCLVRDGETFAYTVKGFLNQMGQLDVGFLIEDEIFDDYEYLYEKYITLKVDRIDLEFVDKD